MAGVVWRGVALRSGGYNRGSTIIYNSTIESVGYKPMSPTLLDQSDMSHVTKYSVKLYTTTRIMYDILTAKGARVSQSCK